MVLAEFQIKFFISRMSFLASHAGRGVFYFFVGSLCYAVFGIDGVISVFLIIVGIVVMLVGIIQVVYHFIGHKLGSSSSVQTSNNSGSSHYAMDYGISNNTQYKVTELQDPNFDPNVYSRDISIGGPQAASLEAAGLEAPKYEML